MSISTLPYEVLERIVYFVQRPTPEPGTGCTRKEFHQHGLTVLLRVSRRFLNTAGKALYTNPVIGNPHQFFSNLGQSPLSGQSSLKVELFRHVKILDLTHRQSLKDGIMGSYRDLPKEERIKWEDDFLSKMDCDLHNCANALKILQDSCIADRLKEVWKDGIPHLRIGAYDGGWWFDKITRLNRVPSLRSGKRGNSGIYVEELPTVLYNQIVEKHDEAEEFGLKILELVNPRTIEMYNPFGPMSINGCLSNSISPGRTVITHVNVHELHDHFGPNGGYEDQRLYNIWKGNLNKWYIGPDRKKDENQLMMVHAITREISNFAPKLTDEDEDKHWETVSEVYGIQDLIPQYIKIPDSNQARLSETTIKYVRDNYAITSSEVSSFPREMIKELQVTDSDVIIEKFRIGTWGLMEISRLGMRFLDVHHEKYRFKVLFRSTKS